MEQPFEIRPQPKQRQFLSSPVDVGFFGGSAGGGKTWSLLLCPLYHIDNPDFNAIIFRRNFTEITTPGGLWDEANKIYTKYGAKMKGKPDYLAVFPDFRYVTVDPVTKNMNIRKWVDGAKIKFSHLEYEHNCYDHHGGQYALILFDELTTFTKFQFFYLLSRNRSLCGVAPYARCSTNPDAGSWVKEFIGWYLTDEGYPDPEKAGKVRYFTREENKIIWVEKEWRHPSDPNIGPLSFTFVPAKVDDNPALVSKNPNYKASLMAQDKVSRGRLLDGNWNIREEDGMFNTAWFNFVDEPLIPKDMQLVRYWDRACTEVTKENKEPDWTAGVLCGLSGGNLFIVDFQHFRASPAENEKRILHTAVADGRGITIGLEQEPGSGGKDTVTNYKDNILKDFVVKIDKPDTKKYERCRPWNAMAERGQVFLKKDAPWVRAFLDEAGAFSPLSTYKKDMIDAVSGAFRMLADNSKIFSNYARHHYETFEPPMGVRYCSLYQEEDMKIYGVCLMWSEESKRLYVYDDFVIPTPSLQDLIKTIDEKAPMAIIHGNEKMFSDGESLAYLLTRKGKSVILNRKCDEAASILVVNDMFRNDQITVHTKCYETDLQFREWSLDGNSPGKTRIGCCRALCSITSDLRDQGKLKEVPLIRGYGTKQHTNWSQREVKQAVMAKAAPSQYGGKKDFKWLI